MRSWYLLSLGIIAAAITLPTSQPAYAQTVAEVQATAEAADPSGGMGERIEVHGHWVLRIRDRDGRLLRATEFDNDLLASGSMVLTQLLSRARVMGAWVVRLGSYSEPRPCLTFGTYRECQIGESAQSANNQFLNSSDLTVTPTAENDGIVLAGSVVVDQASLIEWVTTVAWFCEATVTAEDCKSQIPSNAGFTSARLASPEPVEAGQTVEVTVTLTF
jgi:hypothetical protein